MPAPITHILPDANIRRVRILPSQGRLVAHVNQKVSAVDIIAEMPLSYRHTLVDIYSVLKLASSETVESCLRCKVGMRVMQGDVIAEAGGVFHRVVRAPSDGEIVAIGGGRIMIQYLTDIFNLRAGLTGVIKELISDRGVIVEANGALVQGVWGNGHINTAPLVFLPSAPDQELNADSLDDHVQGMVVLGGHCASAKVLLKAKELNLHGLILGSMTADLIPLAKSLDFPIIILEGFGRLPINQLAFKILSEKHQNETVLNAENWDIFEGNRPEVFIPISETGQLSPESDEFTPGQVIRMHGMPYETQIGELKLIHTGLKELPSGLFARVAEILLDTGEQVCVPLSNLDVVE